VKTIKIAAFSDIHGQHSKIQIPEADIVICAGDCTNMGKECEVEDFCVWYGDLPHKHKILIAGNHDWLFEEDPVLAKKLCSDNGIIYLNDTSVTIEGLKFHGSPVQPHFCDWAFNRARNEADSITYNKRTGATISYALIKPHWDMIPTDTDVLITHGPPLSILDELYTAAGNPRGEFVGCNELRKRIEEVKPEVHIFGHIHSNGNMERHINGTSYYNVCTCDKMYTPNQPPVVIEVIR